MKRFIGMLLTLFVLLGVVGPARAGFTVDQSNTNNLTGTGPVILAPSLEFPVGQEVAQTFTVGLSGTLAEVQVYISSRGATQPLILDIRTTTAGVPDASNSSALASVTIPASDFSKTPGNFVTVDLTSFGIVVTPGEMLAIVARTTDTTGYIWDSNTTSDYTRGSAFTRGAGGSTFTIDSGVELGFVTYVDTGVSAVPAPPGLLLAGTAAFFLVGYHRLRRREQTAIA